MPINQANESFEYALDTTASQENLPSGSRPSTPVDAKPLGDDLGLELGADLAVDSLSRLDLGGVYLVFASKIDDLGGVLASKIDGIERISRL